LTHRLDLRGWTAWRGRETLCLTRRVSRISDLKPHSVGDDIGRRGGDFVEVHS
jgi:hypothetical protein